MILRRLKLRNIRSYDQGEIYFPNGVILFEGDIGSGKSTILLATEFALFGLGNEKATSLLSLGKNEGEVELEFEVRGNKVKVHRSLVRVTKKNIRQENCWIEINGKRYLLSPKEMKEKILEILGYNEPIDPKAKSIIFRYAIYTPQEEMKEILNKPSEERLQTIRKALRLEEYKIARDNASLVAKELRTYANIYLKEEVNLPKLEEKIKENEKKKNEELNKLKEIEKVLIDINNEITKYEVELKKLIEELERLMGELKKEEELRKSFDEYNKRINFLNLQLSRNKIEKERLEKQKNNIVLKKPEKLLEEIDEILEKIEKERDKIYEEYTRKQQLLQNYLILIQKKICPTCNQSVDNPIFLSKVEALKKEVKEIENKKIVIEDEIKRLKEMRKEAKIYEDNIKELEKINYQLSIINEQNKNYEEELKELLKKVEELKEKIELSRKAAEEYNIKKKEYEKIESEYKKLIEKRRNLELEKSKTIANIEKYDFEISSIQQEINKIKEKVNKGKRLMEYITWIEECFIPALEKIELTIFKNANREFNDEFSRFFSYLVDDPTKTVMVDEDFTPIVMQESYEQEVSNLSGGERTALALAFRLALNKIVQKRTGIEGGLLILDEPTDGFSKEQIAKMGDLIRELKLDQVIIVSHERELEGFADYIFRVRKENGKSKIYAPI
ncbi:MAG: AAA family ATPase [Candidatus Verstraetearchaeota archaeon]|jgi:exonuclease SbcC|nr:AAA family ATPase [Candidatus Verstraetearchaeota archaeon]